MSSTPPEHPEPSACGSKRGCAGDYGASLAGCKCGTAHLLAVGSRSHSHLLAERQSQMPVIGESRLDGDGLDGEIRCGEEPPGAVDVRPPDLLG